MGSKGQQVDLMSLDVQQVSSAPSGFLLSRDCTLSTTDPAEAVKDTDLVIEAIIENVGIKKDLFGFLDGKAPKDALFASNTSSLSITDVAEAVSAERQALFGGGFPAFPLEYCSLL